MWFKNLTGFREESRQQVHQSITVDGDIMKSLVNGKTFNCGTLETPSLGELRQRVHEVNVSTGTMALREVVEDVQHLHIDESNDGSLFQVASQFNLLEMVSPGVTPENGVDIYENDRTQGPACAIAAGAGTIFRNYFTSVHGQVGQTEGNQIDCLHDIGTALGNADNCLWEMKNGYALASEQGLKKISEHLGSCGDTNLDELRKLLRIGIQWNTQVTISNSAQIVTQAYCSALPVSYSSHSPNLWERFARLVLEASYEATLCAGILNYQRTGNNKIYLTQIGGGAFGNKKDWIINAIQRALNLYKNSNLDVNIVSYGFSDENVQNIVSRYQ